WLRAVLSGPALEFFFSIDGQDFRPIGSVLDATRISDDHGSRLRFTGAMVGLCVQDLNGGGTTADFDFFTVINR
ncbi:MAG TPA: glycoside hydrolase 43 family protein, partial [Actinoplanes sp.]